LRARHRAAEGAEFYAKQSWLEALYKYEQAQQLDPTLPEVKLDLAYTYMQLYQAMAKSSQRPEYGRLCIQSFEEYLKARPNDAQARSYLIQTFVDTNRYDDAVAFFKPDIEKNPPDLEAISTLGQIASKTNRIDQALEWYERRVQTNPKDADGPYNLGVLVWDYLHNHPEVVGQQRLDLGNRGIDALRKAIEIRPADGSGWTYANLVYREKASGEPDDARKNVDNAEAEKYMKVALDLKKAAGKAPPPALPPPVVYPETPDAGATPAAPAKRHH
jgi:tetratricopeptide (TPR) repeat protein